VIFIDKLLLIFEISPYPICLGTQLSHQGWSTCVSAWTWRTRL